MKRDSRYWQLLAALGLWLTASVLAQQPDSAVPPTAEVTTDDSEREKQKDANEPVRERIKDVFRFGSDVRIKPDEQGGDACVIFGDLTVDGEVHDVRVVSGDAKINGVVDGDLVVGLGSADLGPEARVNGDAVVIGGHLQADPSATVEGRRVGISREGLRAKWEEVEQKAPFIGGIGNWMGKGLILGRPLPHQGGWWWMAALGFAILYVLTAVIFNRPITASVDALESQPVGSFFMGVLMFILSGPLVLLLIATGVGIIVVPFVVCAGVIAFLFGKVAVYRFVGQQLGKQVGLAGLQLPLVALAIGIALFYVVYMIPVLGFLAWGIVAPLGFGAVTLAFFRAFRTERGGSHSGSGGGQGNPVSTTAVATVPPVIPGEGALLTTADVSVLPRAGFWIRLAATFLDLLLIGAVSAVVHFPPFFLLAWVAYHVAMWTWKGTTLGGIVFGIKIVRQNGRLLDFAVALIRSLASFFSALVLFMGFFWAGWTRARLSWHDLIAGTMVVKMPKGSSLL